MLLANSVNNVLKKEDGGKGLTLSGMACFTTNELHGKRANNFF